MKKLGLILFGLSYYQNYINGKIKFNHIIDCRYYIDNFNIYLMDYFKKEYDIDIYISSNKNAIQDEILKIYNPTAYHFDDIGIGRNKKIAKGLELLINSNINYDIIIIMRFDIFFQKIFDNKFFNFNKLNIVSILEHNHLIDDNLYIFPNKYLSKIYEIFLNCNDGYKEEAHNLKNIFDKNFDIHYILNQNARVENLSFFKIRYFQNIDFIMNIQSHTFQKNIIYNSKNNTSSICIHNDEIINFSKNTSNKCDFAWIGYNLEKNREYNIKFCFFVDKDINNFNFIKLHKPVRYYNQKNNIIPNKWNDLEINVKTSKEDDLLCFIFDNFIGLINFKIKIILNI